MRHSIAGKVIAALLLAAAVAGCMGRPQAAPAPGPAPTPGPGQEAATQQPARPEDEVSPMPGHRAPDLVLTDVVSGDKLRLSDLKGKVVLLNFWATWCGPCRLEMPAMETLQKELGDRVRVVALGGDSHEGPEQLAAFAADLNLTITVGHDGGEGFEKYRVLGFPTTLLIDQHGIIRMRHTGMLSIDRMREVVAETERMGKEYQPQ